MPWERFKQEDVVDATPYMESVAAAGEADLDAYPDFKYPVPETDSATLNFLGRAGRSTWMHATDYAEAWQLQTVFNRQKNEKDAALPDMSYGEALRHVRTGYAEADPHLVAEIAGAVVAGGPIAAGVRRGALWAATKGGLVESALRWGARHPILGRITAAAAEGGAGGAIEEGVRSAVNESLDVTGGGSFNASDVARDVAFGTLIGGIAAPSMQEALRTVGGGLRYLGGALGLGSVQSEQAASRIMREFAQPGEVADATMARLNDTVSAFVRRNGYMPSMADILPPEKVASLARVVRNVSGLDIRAAELSEEGVARALKAYDRALGMGGPATMSVEQIETGVENLFTSVVERNGKTLVDVPESALDVLTANRAWIAKIAGNAGAGSDAARVVQVLDARTSIGDLRQTFLSFNRTRNVADQRQSVADLGDQIAVQRKYRGGEPDRDAAQSATASARRRRALVCYQSTGRRCVPRERGAESVDARAERDRRLRSERTQDHALGGERHPRYRIAPLLHRRRSYLSRHCTGDPRLRGAHRREGGSRVWRSGQAVEHRARPRGGAGHRPCCCGGQRRFGRP
jgi:hypothetical protein